MIVEQSVPGYGPQAVAMQPRLLAAIVYSTAVGRRLNRDVGTMNETTIPTYDAGASPRMRSPG